MNADLLKLVPAATAAAFVLSISYVCGYFAYLDRSWVSSLTPSDLLALAWQVLPLAIIAFVCGLLASVSSTYLAKAHTDVLDEIARASPRKARLIRLHNTALRIGATVTPIFAVLIPYLLPSSYIYLLYVLIFINIFSAFPYVTRAVPEEHLEMAGSYALIVALTLAAYGFGAGSSATAAERPNNDLVSFKDQSAVCANVVFSGERGVITFDATTKQSSFIRWDSLREVRRSETCAVPSAPQRRQPPVQPPAPQTKANR